MAINLDRAPAGEGGEGGKGELLLGDIVVKLGLVKIC